MLRKLLNKLLDSGGLWFAATMLHLLSAFITTVGITLTAIVVRWFKNNV